MSEAPLQNDNSFGYGLIQASDSTTDPKHLSYASHMSLHALICPPEPLRDGLAILRKSFMMNVRLPP
jgi:hypothetical protein